MKKYKILFTLMLYFFVVFTSYGFQKKKSLNVSDLKIATWNIQDLGKTKDNLEIDFIAKILKNFDLVALQEVVAKDPAGAKAVNRIADALNRLGSKWDYSISNATNSSSSYASERYAYLWKTSKIKLKSKAFLDKELATKIERESFIALFELKKNKTTFYAVNIHARTYDKHPEMEISNFKKYPERLLTNKIIILGDFNLNEKHTVWNPLYKMGFVSTISDQPSTLKRNCKNGNYLNYPIDNIYYPKKHFEKHKGYVLDFVNNCENLKFSRTISDHLPVVAELVVLH
jgi:endonuclease/exonuclease/phosphatase family metal-dependent hydrolase